MTSPFSGTPCGGCWSGAATALSPRPAASRAHWMPLSTSRPKPCSWTSVWATTTVSRSAAGSPGPDPGSPCCSPPPAITSSATSSSSPAALAASSARRGSSTLTSDSSGRAPDSSQGRLSGNQVGAEGQSSGRLSREQDTPPRLQSPSGGAAPPTRVLAPAFRGRSLSATAPRRWAAYRRAHVECGVRRLASNRRSRGGGGAALTAREVQVMLPTGF